ncbi:hypothetical protein ACQEVB_09730 [Pseudonocardia sp. CA-107938]|uniref:hypothetical protein n=1 Tax=Pseudonocardia sp. CA-107938 TaxID=3240021 RepID=UPI003D8BDFF0
MDQASVAKLATQIVRAWTRGPADSVAPPQDDDPEDGAVDFAAYNPLGGSTESRSIPAPFDLVGAIALECQLFVAVSPAGAPQRRLIHHFDMTGVPTDLQASTNSVLEALYAVARMPPDEVRAASVELAAGIDLVPVAMLNRPSVA